MKMAAWIGRESLRHIWQYLPMSAQVHIHTYTCTYTVYYLTVEAVEPVYGGQREGGREAEEMKLGY